MHLLFVAQSALFDSALGREPSDSLGREPVPSQQPCALAEPGDHLTVHLVTIAPGSDLLNSMGHTVLLFSGGTLDPPRAYNWGVFDTAQSGVLTKFLQGELDYYLMAMHWGPFLDWYLAQDRTIIAQRLEIGPAKADALYNVVDGDAQDPDRRRYRYEWATANCSTKARDAVDAAFDGDLFRALDHPVDTTPRFEAMRHFAPWPIPGFAWDFITSSRVDEPLTAWERTMVPQHLMEAIAPLTVVRDGIQRPVVGETCTMHQGLPFAASAPASVWPFAVPGLLGSAALWATRRRASRVAGGLILAYASVLATLGTSSFLLWRSSTLDGVGPTENWLVAGPQTWVLAVAGWRMARAQVLSHNLRLASAVTGALALLAVGINGVPTLSQVNGHILWVLLPGVLVSAWAIWRHGR